MIEITNLLETIISNLFWLETQINEFNSLSFSHGEWIVPPSLICLCPKLNFVIVVEFEYLSVIMYQFFWVFFVKISIVLIFGCNYVCFRIFC